MKSFLIEAKMITPDHITFECPFCWSKYKQNGEPYKTAKHHLHTHGNDTSTSENRITYRSSHCHRPEYDEVIINITDNTIRKGF